MAKIIKYNDPFLKRDLEVQDILPLFENPPGIPLSSSYFFPDEEKRTLYVNPEFYGSDNETNFLRLCADILKNGKEVIDRTGVGTVYLFCPSSLSYDLLDGKIPCFTTKRVPFKNTVKELLWFISGSTDSNILLKDGVDWWKGNTTREFLDSRGLTDLPEGDVGKMYGYQWRKRNPDQLARLIENIKKVKEGDVSQSRRLMMTAYIPDDLDKGVLEPCHTFVQFDVDGEYLESVLYQRSGDMFLGVQINILSYSILTHMIADVCGLKARRFHHHIANAHIYKTHIAQMCHQMIRTPRESPRLILKHRDNIDDFVLEDFSIEGYNSYGAIKAPMAV